VRQGRAQLLPTFAQLLRARVGRHVVDRTGFQGTYDLEREWSCDFGLQQAPPGAAGATELAPEGLSLFTALQEQLSLRLQPDHGPVTVVVIDSAEPPPAN